MAASSIFFDGRVISIPGSYSQVDASGLETVGLGASGIVAVLGTAEGGIPVNAITDPFNQIPRYNTPEKMRNAFRSGQLREVADMLFAPGKDPDILAGAQQVLAMKVNESTQSVASLTAAAVPQIDLTSDDYGAFTSQINITLQNGTNKGKQIHILFENLVETVDDLGGDTVFSLQYSGSTQGYTTATASVDAVGAVSVNATKTSLGLSGDLSNPATNAAIEIVSSSAGDVTQVITIYGVAGGVATKEVLSLNGTTVVPGAVVWDVAGVLAVVMSVAAAGTVKVRTLGGAGVDIFVMAPAATSKGALQCQYCFVNKTTFSVVLDGAGTNKIVVFGKNAAGSVISEAITLNGTTPVVSVGNTYAQIDLVGLAALSSARTITVSALASKTDATVQTTLQKVRDFFESKHTVIAGPADRGFIFTFGTGQTNFAVGNLDIVSGVNIKNPTTGNFTANLNALIAWINQNSQLITAVKHAGATSVPDNTSSPLFLSGGTEGVASNSDYQNALNLLKKVRVNSIVDLSGVPAVAAMVDAHCAYMGGIGRSERDGFVGLLNNDQSNVTTKTDIKAQIVAINSRHIRAFGQAITRFNSAGDKQRYLPPFEGAIAAGMQAGSPVGTSLTFKFANVLSFDQHSTWNPTDDAEELIQAGLCFMENKEGVGRRWVRNITTHLSSSNLAFTEGSVNNAVNFAVFSFRTAMEFAVGKRGFAGTLAAARSVAVGVLGLLVDNGIITGYRALTLELVLDVLDVSVEIAPVIPINFVKTTVHLVNTPQAA